MRIQWKVTLLVLLTLIGTLTAVIWKTRSVLTKDKLSFIADSSMKQIAPLKRLVQERLDENKSRLVRFAATRSSAGVAGGKSRAFGDFEVVALMQPQTGAAEGQGWQPAWVEKSPVARAEQWPQNFELTLLKSLPYARVKDGETIWARVSDRQGAPLYAVLISVEIQNGAASSANASANTAAGAQASDALPDSTDYKGPAAGGAKRAIVVGFSSLDPVANVTEDYIGSTSVVYLVDDKGYVASHVNKAYLGALFTEDPITTEIVKAHKTSASGKYEDLDSRPVIGHFERVDRTNLFAIITTPQSTVTDSVQSLMTVAVQTGGAVGLLGLILAFLLGRNIGAPIDEASAAIRSLNRGEPHVIRPINSTDEVGTLMRLLAESTPTALKSKTGWNQDKQEPTNSGTTNTNTNTQAAQAELASSERLAEERRGAYEVFNEGFAKAIKEPLLAILGHAQLSKSKSQDPELRSHAESIERESRRAQDVLERLANWTNEAVKVEADTTIDLREVITEALQKSDAELKADGITVNLELHSVPRFHGSAELMKSAIGHLIDNAREAMAARPEKNLRVQLDFLSDAIFLVVADSGVGMSRDVKEKAFDPFYKEFQSPKRLGLGLSFVQTTVKSLGGTAEIESSVGDGASITLKLPVTSEEKELFRNQQTSKLADANSVRFGVPAAVAQTPPPLPPPLPPPVAPLAVSPVMPPAAPPAVTASPTPSNVVTSSMLSNLLTAAAQPRASRNTGVGIPVPAPTLAPLPPEPVVMTEPVSQPPLQTQTMSGINFNGLLLDPLFAPISEKAAAPGAPPSAVPPATGTFNSTLFELEMPHLEPALSLTDDDDDENDNEAFANVPLSTMSFAPPPQAVSPSPTAQAAPIQPPTVVHGAVEAAVENTAQPPEARNFEVKIRRPRVRS